MENNLEDMNNVRDAISQSLGLSLTDDMIEKVMKEESISLDKLLECHTPTEIGVALIRFDNLSKMNHAQEERLVAQKKPLVAGKRVCLKIGPWKPCWDWTVAPPPTI